MELQVCVTYVYHYCETIAHTGTNIAATTTTTTSTEQNTVACMAVLFNTIF